MHIRLLPGWLIPLLFSLSIHVSAQEALSLKASHPEQYRVVEGDTLWDIAGKFLSRPEQWPSLWRINAQIANPNLIYPGDLLVFSMEGGTPAVSLGQRQTGKLTEQKLIPQIREYPLSTAIPLIPYKKIAPYLSFPKVVSKDDIEHAAYVIDFVGEHLIVGSGDGVYVRDLTESNHVNYTIYRQGAVYQDVETAEELGYEAKYIAQAVVKKFGDPATLMITKSRSEIHSGDRLIADSPEELTLNYCPRPPEKVVQGAIIGIVDGVTQIGQYNIVALDKGSEDGLAVGHVLDIYQRGRKILDPFSIDPTTKVSLPDETAGKLMIFRIFPRVSYALIMQANTSIHLLDKVITPK